MKHTRPLWPGMLFLTGLVLGTDRFNKEKGLVKWLAKFHVLASYNGIENPIFTTATLYTHNIPVLIFTHNITRRRYKYYLYLYCSFKKLLLCTVSKT